MTIYSYKLILSYEGTLLLGWQKNRDHPTVEYALECALKEIRLPFFKIEGASRTDAGVHAKGQVARLDLEKPLKNLTQTLIGLNSKLPASVKIISLTSCESPTETTSATRANTSLWTLPTGMLINH
jgi:tRNA pseudouridine38-40 synthase